MSIEEILKNVDPAILGLSSLPKDLLPRLATHLDRQTALSLSLVSRTYTEACERQLWRHLEIILPPYYGVLPLISPYPESNKDAYGDWVKFEARKVEDRRKEALREKVMGTMNRGDGRKWGWVQTINITSRPATLALTQVLDIISPNLSSLTIEPPNNHTFSPHWTPRDAETLDVRLIDTGIIFPSLTDITLVKGSVRHANFILLLVHSSPNLESLNFALTSDLAVTDPTLLASYPPLDLFNRMRKLQISFRQLNGTPPNAAGSGSCEPIPAIFTLIRKSPALRQLSITYHGSPPTSKHVYRHLGNLIQHMAELDTLYLPGLLTKKWVSRAPLVAEGPILPVLRVLAVKGAIGNELDIFKSWPVVPNIETLYIGPILRPSHLIPSPIITEPVTTLLSMTPDLANQLRSSPRLREIHQYRSALIPHAHLDIFHSIKAYNEPSGIVRSFIHGGRELLHLRLKSRYRLVGDMASFTGFASTGAHSVLSDRVQYVDKDGSKRRQLFKEESKEWREYTDLDGLAVPVVVITEMLEAEEMDKNVTGRGIEIGSLGWKIISEWEEGISSQLSGGWMCGHS